MNSRSTEGKKKFTYIEKEFLYDKNFYMLNKMYASKDNKGNGNGYNIIFKEMEMVIILYLIHIL